MTEYDLSVSAGSLLLTFSFLYFAFAGGEVRIILGFTEADTRQIIFFFFIILALTLPDLLFLLLFLALIYSLKT